MTQPAHATEPAIVVAGLALEVCLDFGMGKDEEALVVEAADDGIGDLFDGDGAGFEEAIFFAVVT